MIPAVLIVDDSLTVRMDLAEHLAGAGFAVTTSATLAAAREALAGAAFALVVLDVQLPDGDGIAMLAELRGDPLTAAMPVMMLSGEAEVRDRVRGLTTGADDYVGKPYDPAYVVARARSLIAARQPAAARAALVLVIDDSATFRERFAAELRAAGLAVAVAADGEEGLARAVQLRPAVAVVDRVMPGIDGLTVIRRLRQDRAMRLTACLLLTASDAPDEELRALEAGADGFLRKDHELSLAVARVDGLVRGWLAAAGGEPDAASLLGPKRILVIDEDPAWPARLGERLRDDGCETIAARSGAEALELLAVQPVDAILLDLDVGGLSGPETCLRIKQSPAWRDIPLLIITAGESRETQIASVDLGADGCAPRDGDLEVVRARLRALLRRQQAMAEVRAQREQLQRRELLSAGMRAAHQLAETRADLLADLEARFQELEAFSYSASHDLRAPLRSLAGFSRALNEDYAGVLDARGQDYLGRIARAATGMGQLIEALLSLARVARGDLARSAVDVSALAAEIDEQLRLTSPGRQVTTTIAPGLQARGDARLLRIVLVNLIGNAWKYSARRAHAHIAIDAVVQGGERVFRVVDDGAGFDMAHADKLFGAFQRLHRSDDFEGTGIGLATVRRIIQRHGGRIWAEAAPDQGATFFFTVPDLPPAGKDPRP